MEFGEDDKLCGTYNIVQTCATCEKSGQGRNPDERTCFAVSWLRIVLIGPRFVKCNHTCKKWALNKTRFYNGR